MDFPWCQFFGVISAAVLFYIALFQAVSYFTDEKDESNL
jgi:nicotinamide riboside transporter PnuC